MASSQRGQSAAELKALAPTAHSIWQETSLSGWPIGMERTITSPRHIVIHKGHRLEHSVSYAAAPTLVAFPRCERHSVVGIHPNLEQRIEDFAAPSDPDSVPESDDSQLRNGRTVNDGLGSPCGSTYVLGTITDLAGEQFRGKGVEGPSPFAGLGFGPSAWSVAINYSGTSAGVWTVWLIHAGQASDRIPVQLQSSCAYSSAIVRFQQNH